MSTVLFGPPPYDFDAIEATIADSRFRSAAMIVLGLPDRWDRALDELGCLLDAYAYRGRDETPLYKVLDILIWRSQQRDNMPELLKRIAERIGIGHLYRQKWVLVHDTTPITPADLGPLAWNHFQAEDRREEQEQIVGDIVARGAATRQQREDAMRRRRGFPTAADIANWKKATA
jgi:hypothetical protein